jgi:hypothetical protein
MTADLAAPPVADVLGQAHQLHLSIGTNGGPLVTPELYAVVAGHLWCLTARSTAKARLTSDGDPVGVSVAQPGRAVVVLGRATVYDAVRPHTLLAKLSHLGPAAAGVASFVARNSFELGGAVRDAVTGRLGGPVPEPRLLLGIEPEAVVHVAGDTVPLALGSWPRPTGAVPAAGDAPPEPPDDPTSWPPECAGAVTTVVGWMARGRPLALPATWDPAERVARLPADLFAAVGADVEGPASLCFDRWTGIGPSGKRGAVVRGRGRAVDEGRCVVVRVLPERVTRWNGVHLAEGSGAVAGVGTGAAAHPTVAR